MSLPEGSVCASHPSAAATFSCPRCGSFMCVECERRTRPEAIPLCPKCWDLRAKVTVPQDNDRSQRMQSLGFGLGIASILPIWPIVLGSIIINIISLTRAKEGVLREKRWKSIAGLSISVISMLIWGCIVVFAIAR